MIVVYLYCAFSYLFMIGSAAYEISNKVKEPSLLYFLFVFASPITMPFVFGYELSYRNSNN